MLEKGRTMNRSEFVRQVAERAGTTDDEARGMLETQEDVLVENASAGRRVVFPGFGTFQVERRRHGGGKNPRTGEEYPPRGTARLKFRMSRRLEGRLTGDGEGEGGEDG